MVRASPERLLLWSDRVSTSSPGEGLVGTPVASSGWQWRWIEATDRCEPRILLAVAKRWPSREASGAALGPLGMGTRVGRPTPAGGGCRHGCRETGLDERGVGVCSGWVTKVKWRFPS